jgi:hypothetical protein
MLMRRILLSICGYVALESSSLLFIMLYPSLRIVKYSTVHSQIRLKKEQEEKEHKKKEKAEAHLYTIIKVWSSFVCSSFSLGKSS